MMTDQLAGKPGVVQSARIDWPIAAWGLGWEVKGSKRKHWTGDLTSPEYNLPFRSSRNSLLGRPGAQCRVGSVRESINNPPLALRPASVVTFKQLGHQRGQLTGSA